MRRVFVLVLCLLVMSGCRTLTALVVNEDGSGTFLTEIEIENRYFQLLSQQGDPIEALEENAADASFEVKTERLDTDKTKGLRASFEFSDIEDMRSKFAELNTEETGGSTLFADATIGEEETGWVFEAAQEGAGAGGEDTEEILDPEELKEILDARVQVTLPGAVGEHNATEVNGGAQIDLGSGDSSASTTFTWELSPGSAQEFSAHTLIPQSFLDKLLGPLGLALLGVLVVGGGIAWLLRSRKGASPPAEPAG